MQIRPYLYFEGRCDEAIAFYRKVFGAEVLMLMRRKDAPQGQGGDACPSADAEKVLHATLRIGDSIVQLSDGRCQGSPKFQGVSLSVTVENGTDAERIFAALSDGGKVGMPMAKTFFSSHFGMVADRFGVSWMVYVAS